MSSWALTGRLVRVWRRLLALLNNARNQLRDGLLRADGPGRAPWLQQFAALIAALSGKLGHLLASQSQEDKVAEALKPAEPELVWNFLVEVALNADDKQRASLHEELSPGLANVQVRTPTHCSALLCYAGHCPLCTRWPSFCAVFSCTEGGARACQAFHDKAGTTMPQEVTVLRTALQVKDDQLQ